MLFMKSVKSGTLLVSGQAWREAGFPPAIRIFVLLLNQLRWKKMKKIKMLI